MVLSCVKVLSPTARPMNREKILVVDDEPDILELVSYNLNKEGYHVICLDSGAGVVERAQEEQPQLIVLDLMLPEVNGLDICRSLKNNPRTALTPIIMLTAKGEETDIVAGLELGADDYITKPFSPKVLVARARAVLRRNQSPGPVGSQRLTINGLVIDPARHKTLVNESELDLTATEFRILHFLARRRGCVYTRGQIVEAVHGDDYPVTDRSIDVQVVGIRKKLGDCGDLIETVRGVGYRFKG